MRIASVCSFRPGREGTGRAVSGQAMVEFALIVLFAFLPLTFGIIEVGRAVWTWNQLSQLSREGARWVVVTTVNTSTNGSFTDNGNYGSASGTSYNVASCGCTANTAVAHVGRMASGIGREELTVMIQQPVTVNGATRATPIPQNASALGATHGRDIRVQVRYPFRPVIATILNIPATITMSAETTMQLE